MLVAADAHPVHVDALFRDDVREVRIVREPPVRLAEIRCQDRPGPGRGSVEAPDSFDRPVPEFEQLLAVRVLDLLPEVEGRRAARDVVDPCRIPVDVGEERVRERVRGARGGKLAGAVPHEHECAGHDRDQKRTATDDLRHEQHGDRRREDHDEQHLRGTRRERDHVHAIQPLEQRQAECVGIEALPHLVRRRQDEIEGDPGRRTDGERVDRPTLDPECRAREQERRKVDQVPLDGLRRERRRDVRSLDRGVEAEADDRRDEHAPKRAQLPAELFSRSPPQCREPGHQREDAQPDRECAGCAHAEGEHPVLVEPGRDQPLRRLMTEDGAQ